MEHLIKKIELKDDGVFPNNYLPVLLYKQVLFPSVFFPATHIANLFENNYWYNTYNSGIFSYHHYSSTSHKAIGVYKGKTVLQLGGEKGVQIIIWKDDVLIVPAGVACKNLGRENNVKCVTAHPYGRSGDMNYGKAAERPQADKNIAAALIPPTDPVFGTDKGLPEIWRQTAYNQPDEMKHTQQLSFNY
jgi:uncharacterized protein YjlB